MRVDAPLSLVSRLFPLASPYRHMHACRPVRDPSLSLACGAILAEGEPVECLIMLASSAWSAKGPPSIPLLSCGERAPVTRAERSSLDDRVEKCYMCFPVHRAPQPYRPFLLFPSPIHIYPLVP